MGLILHFEGEESFLHIDGRGFVGKGSVAFWVREEHPGFNLPI